MSRKWWISLAAVYLMAMAIIAALIVPRLLNNDPDVNELKTVIPAHWWKVSMSTEQFQLLKESWGSKQNEQLFEEYAQRIGGNVMNTIPVIDLLQLLCPDVVLEFPQEMFDAFTILRVGWTPGEQMPSIPYLAGGVGGGGRTESSKYSFYLGMEGDEGKNLKVAPWSKEVPETNYRISLYIDDAVE